MKFSSRSQIFSLSRKGGKDWRCSRGKQELSRIVGASLVEKMGQCGGHWKNQLGPILILTLGCHFLVACRDHQLEREFVKDHQNQVERLRSYSLPDQYKIFRYGNDYVEPPLMDLADPIAERGEAAVPFLKEQLNLSDDEIALRDILWVFERMKALGHYDVARDADLIRLLTARVHGMKDTLWQKTCLDSLRAITPQ